MPQIAVVIANAALYCTTSSLLSYYTNTFASFTLFLFDDDLNLVFLDKPKCFWQDVCAAEYLLKVTVLCVINPIKLA